VPFWDSESRKNEKMKKIFVTVILTVVAYQLYCQVDSVERQILSYENSKSVTISKGRSLLLDKFLENDMAKVKEIKNYLIEKGEDENYIALYTAEYWLILYWTNEYEELLESIKKINLNPTTQYQIYPRYVRGYYSSRIDTRIAPLPDMLYNKLLLYSKENEDEIVNLIYAATIDMEKKEFLRLNFESMIKKSDSYQDTLNVQVDSYLKTYPESELNGYVRNYIKYKYVLGNWGGAFEAFFGMSFPTGELRDMYSDDVLGGGAIDVYYKKFEFVLRMFGGSLRAKRDMEYSTGFYPKDSAMTAFLPELSFGYAVFENHRIKLAPFVGIGGLFIHASSTKRKEIPALKEFSISAFAFNLGTSFDIRFGKKPRYLYYPNSYGGFLRIRYNLCLPIFSNRHHTISSQMHTVTIGVGIFSRDLKREY
jgi:hypothetical protein